MGPKRKNKGKPKKLRPKTPPRSLGRRVPVRTINKTILIVCEDSKASPDYFKKFRKELRLSSVNVDVCGKECGSAPMSVVTFARDKKNEVVTSLTHDDYDEIFCVIDIDDHPPIQIQNAIQTARDNGLKLIISNPCFEYWYILHFERTGSSFSSRPALYKKLGNLLGGKYEKGCCDFFDELYPQTEMAIANSKGIWSSQWQNEPDPIKRDPSTDVHRVVGCIMDMAS